MSGAEETVELEVATSVNSLPGIDSDRDGVTGKLFSYIGSPIKQYGFTGVSHLWALV